LWYNNCKHYNLSSAPVASRGYFSPPGGFSFAAGWGVLGNPLDSVDKVYIIIGREYLESRREARLLRRGILIDFDDSPLIEVTQRKTLL
jgi:hypothetical protein